MKRNIEKAISDFRKMPHGGLKVSEMETIYDISKNENGARNAGGVVLYSIFNSYAAGYVYGYRAAKRDSRKKQ